MVDGDFEGRHGMAKRMSVDLSDEDLAAIHALKAKFGQQNETAVIRLCIHLVSCAEKILLNLEPHDQPCLLSNRTSP